jgi:hypothetical protein
VESASEVAGRSSSTRAAAPSTNTERLIRPPD